MGLLRLGSQLLPKKKPQATDPSDSDSSFDLEGLENIHFPTQGPFYGKTQYGIAQREQLYKQREQLYKEREQVLKDQKKRRDITNEKGEPTPTQCWTCDQPIDYPEPYLTQCNVCAPGGKSGLGAAQKKNPATNPHVGAYLQTQGPFYGKLQSGIAHREQLYKQREQLYKEREQVLKDQKKRRDITNEKGEPTPTQCWTCDQPIDYPGPYLTQCNVCAPGGIPGLGAAQKKKPVSNKRL